MAIELAETPTEKAAPPASPASSPPSPSAPTETPPDWRASLPDDLKASKSLERYKDLPAFVKGHLDLESAYGKKVEGMVKLPVPGADGKLNDAEVAAFRKAIGVPDTAEGYKLEVADDLRDLVSEDGLAQFGAVFHHLAIPAPAAQGIVQAFAEFSQQRLAAVDRDYRAKVADLRAEWGEATYNRRMALAKKVWDTEIPEDLRDILDQTRIGSHPSLITFLAKYGEDLAESGHIDAQLVQAAPTLTALQARRGEIESDADFISDRNPAKHAALVKEWNDIFAQMNPEALRK